MSEESIPTLKESELVEQIFASKGNSSVVRTKLRTDERVIARVTDGIYRQPGSALRELISNAYDADATRVTINTDAPRFERISIQDNGHGMSPYALAHVLHHIGGSAKRSDKGAELGVTKKEDPLRSPGGRRLIGKIGIGLFSVAQLTRTFQIITKVKGDDYRTIATVALKQYTDEVYQASSEGDGSFESGKVNIWREPAQDIESHGTTIVLTGVRNQSRDTLRSRDIWSAIEQYENSLEFQDDRLPIDPPEFHIGRIDTNSSSNLKRTSEILDSVPWTAEDKPDDAFRLLVAAVWNKVVESSDPNPKLSRIFDYYLQMAWQLSLAIPVEYIEGNLFDLKLKDEVDVFELSNSSKGSAVSIPLKDNQSIREALKISGEIEPSSEFEVIFDNLKLMRPIRYQNLPMTSHAIKRPLVFIGKFREEFPGIPRELSGGPLSFVAYLFWTPKVAPTEHRGSLIRIHGASGTLFDPTFMRYQVAEIRRLNQITCEIFVSEGLEGALNIDRESFNYAHPHAVVITNWLHSALRQLASTEKKLGDEVRKMDRQVQHGTFESQVNKVVSDVWRKENDDPAASPPAVEFLDRTEVPANPGESKSFRPKPLPADTYVFSRSAVISDSEKPKTAKSKFANQKLEFKLKAIIQVLASFNLLDNISRRKQEDLLQAIYRILETSD